MSLAAANSRRHRRHEHQHNPLKLRAGRRVRTLHSPLAMSSPRVIVAGATTAITRRTTLRKAFLGGRGSALVWVAASCYPATGASRRRRCSESNRPALQDASQWAAEALNKRPQRPAFFEAMAAELEHRGARQVLELNARTERASGTVLPD
jgi:hypothetical protein